MIVYGHVIEPNANLSGTDLRSANLSGTDLRSANLSGANLSGANLSGANLRNANLRSAILSGANLSGANLSGTDLRSANLRNANLRNAILSGANLRSADLRGTIGNMNEVKSLQLEDWPITYTSHVLAIGCQCHPIDVWLGFSDEDIDDMDYGALDWWRKWKPVLQNIIELSPAKPTSE